MILVCCCDNLYAWPCWNVCSVHMFHQPLVSIWRSPLVQCPWSVGTWSLCRGAGECPIWLLLTLVETLFASFSFSFSSSCHLSSFSSSLSFWYSLAHLTITWQMTFGGSVPSGRSGTLHKNLGNGSFADFLAAISVNFIESGARQNWAPILAILPIRLNWAWSIGIRPNQTRSGLDFGNAPNQRPNFGDAPISHDAKKWCAAAAPCLPRWTRWW